MKAKIETPKPSFTPVNLHLTFETQDELNTFRDIFGCIIPIELTDAITSTKYCASNWISKLSPNTISNLMVSIFNELNPII